MKHTRHAKDQIFRFMWQRHRLHAMVLPPVAGVVTDAEPVVTPVAGTRNAVPAEVHQECSTSATSA